MFNKRRDLVYTGRTLFGARSPKGPGADDHYFGAIKPKVSAFMRELDEELWKLGVLAKTEHNEVAPLSARACPRIHDDEHSLRSQPARDGNDAEDRA